MTYYLNPQVAMGLEGSFATRFIYETMLSQIRLSESGKCIGIGPMLADNVVLSRHLILVKTFVALEEAPVLVITDKDFVETSCSTDVKIEALRHCEPKYLYISLASGSRYFDGEDWVIGMYVYLGPVGPSPLQTPSGKAQDSIILWVAYIYDSTEHASEDSQTLGHGCILLEVEDGKTISQMANSWPNQAKSNVALVQKLSCLAYSAIVHEEWSADGSRLIKDID